MVSWLPAIYRGEHLENVDKSPRSCWIPPKEREMQISIYPNRKLRLKNSQNVTELRPS